MISRYPFSLLIAVAFICLLSCFWVEAGNRSNGEKADLQVLKEGKDLIVHGQIDIPAPERLVWAVLTNYDSLETFIPHLEESRILKRMENGRIRLEQVAWQGFLFFRKRVRIVLDVAEDPPHQISFSLVEGNFHTYVGAWEIDSYRTSVRIHFKLRARPVFYLPGFILKRIIRTSVVQSLEAVREETLKRRIQFEAEKTTHRC